ncbi:MAG: hypothetical protein ACJAQ6_002241 [Arenicella sp.]|jgi:hypothetical protein
MIGTFIANNLNYLATINRDAAIRAISMFK